MNRLNAKVIHIENIDNLHYLSCSIGREIIHMITLELNSSIKIGTDVNISIKSTNIGISKSIKKDISIENQLKAKVIHIDNGAILSSVCLDIEGFEIESVISLNACKRLGLKVDDEVFALMSESSIFIMDVGV